jgi:hypothetical protein
MPRRLLAEELLQSLHAFEQRGVAERVGEAQISARTERFAGDDGDLGAIQDEIGELE